MVSQNRYLNYGELLFYGSIDEDVSSCPWAKRCLYYNGY
jgi:hypothetical protein